ncbi:MAG: hypothetical protein ACRC2V_26235 [Xenococcaceae cyanobacterium]
MSTYTKAAALRILIGVARRVEKVNTECCRGVIQVTYISVNGGRCSTFLSKKAFVVSDQEFRVTGASQVEIIEVVDDDHFIVQSKKTDNYYVVRPYHYNERQRCECGDCHWRGRKCKHQIAVEQFLNQRFAIAA